MCKERQQLHSTSRLSVRQREGSEGEGKMRGRDYALETSLTMEAQKPGDYYRGQIPQVLH